MNTNSNLSKMPRLGFGLWKVPNDICAETVYAAIKIGYRHFDCACDYGNETEVGEGFQRAFDEGLCKREDLWVTSKLWNTYHAQEHVEPAIRKSLEDLGLDYLDLYLIHFPIALSYVPFDTLYPPEWINPSTGKFEKAQIPLHETWKGMEDIHRSGLAKEIGVCNYNTGLLHDLMSYANVRPTHLQIESHPLLTQEKLIDLCAEFEIQVTAFSPLASLSYVELSMAGESDSILDAEPIEAAAKAHGKSSAQILLRWGIQRGTSVIPKSTNPEHMRSNLEVFDFELSDEEMDAISGMNQNRRFNDPGVFTKPAFGESYPIYD